MSRKLLLFPGMTPSRRIYQKLAPRLGSVEIVDWSPPKCARTISEYAAQLIDQRGMDSSWDLVGVSFGGIVAQEIAALLRSPLCMVVSSIGSTSELPLAQRLLTRCPQGADQTLLRTVGEIANCWPNRRANWATVRARKFGGPDGDWYRWASAVMRWRRHCPGQPGVVRIHGDRDRTFPLGAQCADVLIPGAGHLLAVTHSDELARAIHRRRDGVQ